MVFGARRTIIDAEHVPAILDADGYREISQQEAQVGDILVYSHDTGDVAHVALIVNVKANIEKAVFEIEALSQFGRDGEFFHAANDIPVSLELAGKISLAIWTERGRHNELGWNAK